MVGRRTVTGQGESAQDISARDDAHLESLGIKPQLNRSLGFLANFALAFSFISVSTGSFGNFGVGFGLGGPPMFWTWLIIVAGQFLVALGFAELASHYPVAGSIYQWSKRLSHRTLGWFTGWFYFWAQVVTVTAVACIVAFVVDGIMGEKDFLASPSPLGVSDMFTFIAITTLVITTLINAFGVRLVATLNNIGVATEILGMLVFALILLFFANHQSPDVLTQTFGAEQAQNGNMLATFALAFFMSIFILYGFDTAGTFGEETIDASRQAPRGVLTSVLISGAVGVVFLLAIILSLEDIPKTMADGLAGQFPIATTIQDNLSSELIGGITVGEVYLFVILASVFVCTLAIQGAATRMMFSMGRDGNLPGGRAWAHVNERFRTPTNAAIAVGILAAIPILLVGPIGGITLSIAATGLIYLSYFLCNIGLLVARRRGWPHKKAWFSLGRWGMPINILALIWGAIMLVNIALWASPELFGDFGSAGRGYWNPLINGLFAINGQKLDGLPAWPLFETLVGLLLVFGSIYYLIAVRGRAVEIEADAVTGEGVIG
jgi:urea carboxylase system permease